MTTLQTLAVAVLLGAAFVAGGPYKDARADIVFLVQPTLIGADLVDDPSTLGAFVKDVIPGKPFSNAGIQQGDVIVAINNTPVVSAAQAYSLIDNPPPGTTFLVKVKDVNTGKFYDVLVKV
jgi:S1-C subfamily serine protease